MTDSLSTPQTHRRLVPELLSWRTGVIVLVAFSASLVTSFCVDGGRPLLLNGTLQAPETCVTAPRAVTLREHLVQARDLVRQGQDVARVEDASVPALIRTQQLQREALRAELEQVNARADLELAWRLKDLDAEILQQQMLSADLLKRQFNSQLMFHAWKQAAQSAGNRLDRISDRPLVPILFEVAATTTATPFQALLEHQTARNAADVYAVQIEICNQRIERLKRLRDELPDKVRSAAEIERVQARLQQCETQLKQVQERSASPRVVSQGFGTVIRRYGVPGDRLQAGDPIVTLLDRHRCYVAVEVPSDLVGRFVEDATVVLVFAGGLECQGRLRTIPLRTSPGHSTVRVQIEPTGRLWPQVPIGSEIRVRVPAVSPGQPES